MQVTQINNSSNVFRIGHDGTDLYCEMKGGTYKYFNVPEKLYFDMIAAESAGKFLNEFIKPHYQTLRVEIDLLAAQAAQELPELVANAPDSTSVVEIVDMFNDQFGVRHTGTLLRATEQAAAYDLSSNSDTAIVIQPGQRAVIDTGVSVELPLWMAAQVLSRSGLAAKKGIMVLNAPGLIDPDYRDHIKVILFNAGDEAFTVNKGDRIAQLMFVPYFAPTLKPVEAIDVDTARGKGGLGSTGVTAYEATPLMPRTKSA